ncbi:MAG: hypothetical protein GC159_16645 [Phycisphaera sp.]|nr:hypothetical protein [Phycisphaera sp.]
MSRHAISGWIIALAAALLIAPLASLASAEEKPDPDPSKVMLFVEASPNFPGAQKKAGSPLEQLAGITPQSAKQYQTWALNMKDNFDFGRDGFDVKIVSDLTGEAAMKKAEEAGVGSVLLLTILRRAVKDIGQSEMIIEVEASYYIKPDKSHGWQKKFSKQYKAESQGFEGKRRIHDIDVIARTMEDLLRDMLFKYAVPYRVKSADLRGTPRTITVQVTNETQRTINGLEMEVPAGRESFVVASTDVIQPGEKVDAKFVLQNDDPTTSVVWSKGNLTDVHFQGEISGAVAGPAGDTPRPTLKERFEALRKRRESGAGRPGGPGGPGAGPGRSRE